MFGKSVDKSLECKSFSPGMGEIMSAARPSSTSDSDSTSTDSEMPSLVAVARAPEEEPREPHIQRRSNGSEVDALADETIEGLFEATKQKIPPDVVIEFLLAPLPRGLYRSYRCRPRRDFDHGGK